MAGVGLEENFYLGTGVMAEHRGKRDEEVASYVLGATLNPGSLAAEESAVYAGARLVAS